MYGTLGEANLLLGSVRTTVDAAAAQAATITNGGIGFELGLQLLWDFGADGSITTEIPVGLVLKPPSGPQGLGAYRGAGNIVAGTGKFQKAVGTILLEGPYIVWFQDPAKPDSVQGQWNADVTIRVCNLQ